MQKYISKLMRLFLEPSKFIKSVSKEKDYWEITKFFAVSYVFVLLITLILSALITLRMGSSLSIENTLREFAIGILYAFAVPYVGSALMHAGVWIFEVRQGYFNTFKPVTYGFVLYLIYNLFSVLTTGIMQLVKPIYPGTPYSQTHATVIVVIAGLFALTGSIIALSTQTIGASLYQKISKGKAFLGIILIPLISIIVIYLLVLIILTKLGFETILSQGII